MNHNVEDPYRRCESGCPHDLSRGVLLQELLGGDGPYPIVVIRPEIARREAA